MKRPKTKRLPDSQTLKELFDYWPETGELVWRSHPFGDHGPTHSANSLKNRIIGSLAGWNTREGYRVLMINNTSYMAHRIIWKMVYDEEPKIIDHINGDRQDNRIANLRSVSIAENCRNFKTTSRNTSGVVGVAWAKDKKKWVAQMEMNQKCFKLGCFDDFFEAVCARKSAESKNGFIYRPTSDAK